MQALDFQFLTETWNSTISEIIARSNSGNKSISWSLDTETEIINSTLLIYLNESETAMIFIENYYLLDGVYITNASINSSEYTDDSQGVFTQTP